MKNEQGQEKWTMRYLHRTWTGSGPEVDRKWTGSGPEVDRKWTGSGQEVDRKWTGSGPEMDDVMNKMLERLHVCVQTKKKGQYGGNIFPPPHREKLRLSIFSLEYFASTLDNLHFVNKTTHTDILFIFEYFFDYLVFVRGGGGHIHTILVLFKGIVSRD